MKISLFLTTYFTECLSQNRATFLNLNASPCSRMIGNVRVTVVRTHHSDFRPLLDTLSCCVSLFLTETFSSQPSTYCVKQTDVEYYQPKGERPLNRDNIGLLAKFADRNRPEKLLCVATTHLLYNPRRVDVRLA